MEKINWKRTGLLSGGITSVLGAVALAVVSFLDRGTVIVNSVPELIEAIQNARPDDIIVIGTNGSPYDLSIAESMHRTGHLYIDKRIKIRGQSGRPSDVVLQGSTNRIMYLRAQGIQIANLSFVNGDCSKTYKDQDIKESPSDYRKGGGICCGLATNEVEVMNCKFKNCLAEYGGAVAKNSGEIDSTIKLKNVVIEDCVASVDGGGCYGIGIIEGATFTGNNVSRYGGAVANVEIVKNGAFTDNTALKGGCVGYKSGFKEGTVRQWYYGGWNEGEGAAINTCRICGTAFVNGECPYKDDDNHRCDECGEMYEYGAECGNSDCEYKSAKIFCPQCGSRFDQYGVCLDTTCPNFDETAIITKKGGVLLDCNAEGLDIKCEGYASRMTAMFHDTDLFRCKISAANTYLFSGKYTLRNSLIYEGYNITLNRSSTNENRWVNCTVVSNRLYSILSNSKIVHQLRIQNGLFFGNSHKATSKRFTINENILFKNLSNYSTSWIYTWYKDKFGQNEDPKMWEVYKALIIEAQGADPGDASEISELAGESYTVPWSRDYDFINSEYYKGSSDSSPTILETVWGNFENGDNNWTDTIPGFLGIEASPDHPYALADDSQVKSKGSAEYEGVSGSYDLRGRYKIDSGDMKYTPIGCYLSFTPRKRTGFRVVIR